MSTDSAVVDLAYAVAAQAVGGKAGTLAELVRAGLPVPPGVVITCTDAGAGRKP